MSPQAETRSAPDETSPLLPAPSETAKSHIPWLSPTTPQATSKKQHDLEGRSAGHGDEESSSPGEISDDAPSKKASVMSFIAVLYFGILPTMVL